MSESHEDLRTLTPEEVGPRAEALVRCGLPLIHPEALETDAIYDLTDVLWASTQSDQHAFGFLLFFDLEMIYGEDDYPSLIRDIASSTGRVHLLTHASSRFAADGHQITVCYTFNGVARTLTFDQLSDWIPAEVGKTIFDDVGSVPGRVRLAEWSGQSATVVWILPDHVHEFMALESDFEVW